MKQILVAALVSLSFLSNYVDGANILFFIGQGSYSHRVPIQPLMDALADKGHNVTMLSSFPPKNPNPKIREFHPPKLLKWQEESHEEFDAFKFRQDSQVIYSWFLLPSFGIEACENLYTDHVFINWLADPSTKFDVVVMDSLLNECAYGIAYYLKAKIVAFNTGQMYPWQLESHYGIPDESSSIPEGMLHMPIKMNLFQRAATALVPIVWKVCREFFLFPRLEEITKKGLALDEMPSFKEIEANTSLALVNNYWAQELPRSLPPNVIPVGGIAMKAAGSQPLPQNIEDFIQKGAEGFIYVSFGTVAEFTKFSPEVRQAFIGMIQNFPNIQFIWKSTHPIKEQLPVNVMVEKWLPQADILTHPKIRLFITHGGLGGIYEAIYSKVPMICFPVFAEQEYNADLMEHKGYGIKLELTTLAEVEITTAVRKMLNDPSYKRQVEKVALLLNDRPIGPLESAVWWVEFILRHDNLNEFIRPLSVTQSWWVRRQLDTWALIFLVTALVITVIYFVMYTIGKFILKRFYRMGQASHKSGSLETLKTKQKQRAKLD